MHYCQGITENPQAALTSEDADTETLIAFDLSFPLFLNTVRWKGPLPRALDGLRIFKTLFAVLWAWG